MAAWRTIPEIAHLLDRLDDPVDPAVAACVEQVAFASRGCAPRCPMKEPDVQLAFQLLDIAAHSGAADTQAVAGLRKAALGDNGDEGDDARIGRGEAGGQRVNGWGEGGGRGHGSDFRLWGDGVRSCDANHVATVLARGPVTPVNACQCLLKPPPASFAPCAGHPGREPPGVAAKAEPPALKRLPLRFASGVLAPGPWSSLGRGWTLDFLVQPAGTRNRQTAAVGHALAGFLKQLHRLFWLAPRHPQSGKALCGTQLPCLCTLLPGCLQRPLVEVLGFINSCALLTAPSASTPHFRRTPEAFAARKPRDHFVIDPVRAERREHFPAWRIICRELVGYLSDIGAVIWRSSSLQALGEPFRIPQPTDQSVAM